MGGVERLLPPDDVIAHSKKKSFRAKSAKAAKIGAGQCVKDLVTLCEASTGTNSPGDT